MAMTGDTAFFYQILKPGRYLGGEFDSSANGDSSTKRQIVWFYPDRYERAITDPAWRRAFFQISKHDGVRVSRAVEYARDVWQSLAATGKPVFTLDLLTDIRRAEVVVFWAPDIFAAAHIPSIIRRAGLENSGIPIGVICDGYWLPKFLFGHVDWIAPAPSGWLPQEFISFLQEGGTPPRCVVPGTMRTELDSLTGAWREGQLLPSDNARTPRWVPRVEVEEDHADVELTCVDGRGVLRLREVSSVVLDTLDGLSGTGIDGVRFCEGQATESSQLPATVLGELQRRYNMKRVRAQCPPITIDQFGRDWLAYRPHLLKPVLRFRVDGSTDPDSAIDAGNRALNSGWQGLSAVLSFDSFESLIGLLTPVQRTIHGWDHSSRGHADKRPLRLEYRPAPIDQWKDRPDGPDDDTVRQYSSELRRFKDELARMASVGTFRVEEIVARNWLAAADGDLWDQLASLDLSDSNDPEAPSFDWFSWVRQEAGLSEPPKSQYAIVKTGIMEPSILSAAVVSPETAGEALQAPADYLFGRRRQKPTLSRRLAAPSLTRMRVQWAKDMPWRLYSHLDLVRAIERAIRKAGLPASYSEGFHPRLKLSFGPPLAFGLLSDSEYFDLMLDEDFQPSQADRLARSFPAGLRLIAARGVAAGMPALSDTITDAVYSAIIPLGVDDAQRKLDEFHSRTEVYWKRIGREDRRPVDPRKTLRSATVEKTDDGTKWELSVLLGSEGNIRPTEWAMLLFGFTTQELADIIIRRRALLVRRGATERTPLDAL